MAGSPPFNEQQSRPVDTRVAASRRPGPLLGRSVGVPLSRKPTGRAQMCSPAHGGGSLSKLIEPGLLRKDGTYHSKQTKRIESFLLPLLSG